jgi:uncharacterized protein YraI
VNRSLRGVATLCMLVLVLGLFTSLIAAQTFAAPVLIANVSFLNVRTGPSIGYPVLVTVTGGTELPVLTVAPDGSWYEVNTGAGPGWVNSEFTVARGYFGNVPVNGSAGQGGGYAPVDVTGNHVVVNTGNLNIRSGPGAGYSVLATVPGGTRLAVAGFAPDGVWVLVDGSWGRGWVNGTYTLFRGDTSLVPIVSPDGGSGGGATGSTAGRVWGGSILGGDFRAAPGSNTPIIQPMLSGQPTLVIPLLGTANVEGRTWYNVLHPDLGNGWTDLFMLRPLICGPGQTAVSLNRSTQFNPLNGSSSFPIENGSEAFLDGFNQGLATIELSDGAKGFVDQVAVNVRPDDVWSYCTGVTTAPPDMGQGGGSVASPTGNRMVVNTGNLNVRTGPGPGFAVITSVPGGTTLAVIGRDTSTWYLVEDAAFGRGWVDGNFGLFRGDFASVPVVDVSSNIVTSAPTTGTEPAPIAPGATGNHLVVNTGHLNVRSGPGVAFAVIATVPGGTSLPVIGRTADGVWFAVEVGGNRGWLNGTYTAFRGNYASVPVIN